MTELSAREQELKAILADIKPTDKTYVEKARQHTASLILPHRALGLLHDMAEKVAAIQENLTPNVSKKAIYVMAGDHGVVRSGVSAYPQEVTGAMVMSFLNGQAGISVLSRHAGAEIFVADVGIIPDVDAKGLQNAHRLTIKKIARGTNDMSQGPAMTRAQAVEAVMTGYELAAAVLEQGFNVLGTGDMGIGNTTPSAAMGVVFTGQPATQMTGPGTGLNPEGVARKAALIESSINLNKPDKSDPLDVLAKVGGFEIGAIAGSILAAGRYKRAIMVDGFISTAGALLAHALCPHITDYMFAAHQSEEGGHKYMWQHLGLKPILSLGMRLGEGTGGALVMQVLEGAVKVFNEMATFEEANVPNK